jgi:hypothetical protein
VPVTTDPGVQQMPSIVADPADPSHLVVAYLDYSLRTTGYAGVGVAVSHDSGTTWQRTSVPLPGSFDQGAASPIAQFDAQGHVYISFEATTFLGGLPTITDPAGGPSRALGFEANNGIFVARSDDGGLTWNAPVAVASYLYDGTNPVPFNIKPDLAVDTFQNLPDGRPNPYYGDLYEVWSRYYPAGLFPGEPTATGGSAVWLAVSQDAGRTWQTGPKSVIVATDTLTVNTGEGVAPGTGFENWSQVAVGPEGDVYIVQGSSGLSVYHSTDGGASFTQPDVTTGAYFPFGSLLNAIPSLTLTNDQFRTQTIRDLAADPTRPGTVYVVISVQVNGSNGNPLDPGDILFARSTDYGVTWQTTFQVGAYGDAGVLNDDNGGNSSTGAAGDVADGEALPRLVTDSQGEVAVIWYDTRRDPADTLLDVYGTVSRDGGHTFSPNFRVTDQSFDPNLGAFTDATGQPDYYMGDDIGLALTGGTAYAAWTDTRNGNQDVFSSGFPIDPPPLPPSNRFGPNATAATATDLGKVVTRSLPRLTVAAGDEEWFRLRAAATGSLTVTAQLAAPADSLRLELYDAGGSTLLASGSAVLNADGQVVGQSLTFPGQSGLTYLVRILPGPAASADTPAVYTLDLQSLTADLGTRVDGVEDGSLAPGQDAYYALFAPAAGSLDVTLTPASSALGNFHLELLNPGNLAVLASGQAAGASQQASLTLTQGQALYLHVFGDAAAQGDFSLGFVNLDQYTTPDDPTLFFPTGGNPCQVVVADLNNDGKPDLVVDYADQNFVSVLLNNGDGTFQAPRDFAVEAFQADNNSTLGGVPDDKRAMVVADFTGNGIPDLAVLNYQSDDISLLLGRGDGTFAPQRVIGLGSLESPFALAAGDLNGDGIPDLVVVSSTGGPGQQGEVLLGRGDGTFESPLAFTIPFDPGFPTNTIQIADLNHDGKNDLVYEGYVTYVLLGKGDGTFGSASRIGWGIQGGLVVTDLNGDGNPDIVTTAPTSFADGAVEYELGNGDGTFQPQVQVLTGQAPIAVALTDLGSQVTLSDGSAVLGPPDGLPDLVVANNGITGNFSSGPPDVVVVPALADGGGHFDGFGSPFVLAAANSPLDLKVADLTGDGTTDVVVAEVGGVEVIYGKPLSLPPNTTPLTARKLGTVVHLAEPVQTIVPGHEDAYYTLTVPTEAARGAGDEIIDFSGLFQGLGGPGLAMEVTDAAGHVLGAGERFQIEAAQGAVLTLHVLGAVGSGGARGSGAYTLDIDVLPQVASVMAQALLPGAGAAPGGPTTSLVITLQGDRLDPTAAEDPANYTVIWTSPNQDVGIPLAAGQGVVYDPSSNVDVASGLTYPTAVRQTVTLLFDEPLPAGAYRIELSPAVQAAPFSDGEAAALSAAPGFVGHPVATVAGGAIVAGYDQDVRDLVSVSSAPGNLAVWEQGTPFLTQLHDDLGALLDAQLTALGDARSISAGIDRQIVTRFDPALGTPDQRPVAVLVIWLDPVVADLDGGRRGRVAFNPQTSTYQNTLSQAFASVTGSVEVLALAFVPTGVQNYVLSVDPTPAARGGLAYFGPLGNQVESLTTALRDGTTQFLLSFGEAVAPSAPATRAPAAAPGSPAPDALRATEAMVALTSVRTDGAAVRPTTPLPAPVPADAPPAVAATTTAAVGSGAGEAQLAGGGGGTTDGPPAPRGGWMQQLLGLVVELGRRFPALGRSLRSVLQSLGVQPAAGMRGPAPQLPAGGERAPGEKDGDEDDVPPPAAGEAVPEAALPPDCGLFAAALALTAGFAIRPNISRGPASGRRKPAGPKNVRPRRPDHAE